jgi:hypothetical protein
MLASARGNRLAVTVRAGGRSVAGASATVDLIRFGTSGRGPSRSAEPSATLQILGGTHFVNAHGVGGLLVACHAATPCRTTTTVSAAGATIARTGREYVDAQGLRYVIFNLNSRGRSLLAHAPGNQLRATVTVNGPDGTATATVALVRFT